MVNALNNIKHMAADDITSEELIAAITELFEMPLETYALSFGGLIVSDDALITYKAEYMAKLVGLLAQKVAA